MRSSSLTVISTFWTQQGTPSWSTAFVWRRSLHGPSFWSRHDVFFELVALKRRSAGKAANEMVRECMKPFTKIVDCSAPRDGGSAFFRSPRSLFERKDGTENIVFLVSGNIMCHLIQVHQGNVNSCWSGHSSGHFELHAPCFYFFIFHVVEVFRVERKFSDSETAFPDSCQTSRS